MTVCEVCNTRVAKYRVEYRDGTSAYFCDFDIIAAGIAPIQSLHNIDYVTVELSCEKLAM